jgi:hypothetical protein
MSNTCVFHEKTEDAIQDHEERIRQLEVKEATLFERIDKLCQKMDDLMGWFKVGVVGAVGTGAGFILWYVQQLSK